jgi:CDGSH-type Zn-finger protein
MSTKITVNNNGSLKVEGDITVCDAQGNAFDLAGRTTVWLCRCGHSGDKPFCDGSHRKAAFQSEIKARQLLPPSSKA